MKKITHFLLVICLILLTSTTELMNTKASTVETVNTRIERRFETLTDTYGTYYVRQYYYTLTTEYVTAGTTHLFEDSCPSGWTVDNGGGGGIDPFSVQVTEPLEEENLDEPIQQSSSIPNLIVCKKISSGYYTFQSSDTYIDLTTLDTIYWNSIPLNQKKSLFYESWILAPSVFFHLYEGEVLLLFDSGGNFVMGMDRYDHYERNMHNHAFPTTKSEFDSSFKNQLNCEEQPDMKNYFHKIAEWNGHTQNFGNVKYLCDVPTQFQTLFPNGNAEVIYNSDGFREISDVVQGTFNFESDTWGHYMYDVYPYLIWGNSFNDNSTFKERYYWDQDSTSKIDGVFIPDYYMFRGETLYIKSTYHFQFDLSDSQLNDIQVLIDNMYAINNN